MFDERVLNPSQFPIAEKNRKSTDVCCTVIGAIFALTMFIVACCLWNQGNYDRLSSLTDSNGKVCDKFLHYPNLNDPTKTKCVSHCPHGFEASSSSAGSRCLPEDEDAREKLLNHPDHSDPFDGFNFRRALLWSALVALGLGLLWMTIVHCMPKYAPIIAFVLAIIGLIALGVLLLVLNGGFWNGGHWLKIVVAIFCFVLAILLIVMACMYSSEIKFQGLMLDYAVRFLNENPCTFAYIPLYLLFTLGLIALICWQQACFSSWWGKHLGWGPASSGVWGVLNILEFIWGLQFLRDSFNFCVSGAAVDWYWTKSSSCYAPYQRLLCKHWGSVVGGSFLNAFFELPTLLIELLVCHPQTCCAKLGTICYNSCTCCTCFFDLVRTDAYSYMNMSGIPFCDSARQCKKICDRSHQFIGTHSAMKHYRFVAHVALVTLALTASYFILRHRVWNFSIWQFGILVVVIYAIVTWFIDIHADAAEGLQTSVLAEHELQGDYQYMDRILPSYREELKFLDGRQKMDGNC